MFANHKHQLIIPIIVFISIMILIPGHQVLAATITVDGTFCTLVNAIEAANTNATVGGCVGDTAGLDTLILDADADLTLGVSAVVAGGQAVTPNITSPITIQAGDGTTIRNSGGGDFRIFNVATGGTLTLEGITVRDGSIAPGTAVGARGGGIHVDAGGTLNLINSTVTNNSVTQTALVTPCAACGGGIYNAGTLSILNSTISNNTLDGPNNTQTRGGGVYNAGTTTEIRYSTISGNIARGGLPAGNALGGGFFSAGNIDRFENTTISNNQAISAGTGRGYGGGLNFRSGVPWPVVGTFINNTISGNTAAYQGGAMEVRLNFTMTNVTIINNTAGNSGDAIRHDGGTVTLANSIVSSPGGSNDCEGTIVDGGNNLRVDTGETSCPAIGTITLGTGTPADEIEDALGDNGGPTQTHALLPGSTAIDRADDTNCPAADQRGADRGVDGDSNPDFPETGDCDIGAYEYNGIVPDVSFTVVPTTIFETGGTTIATVTVTVNNHTAGDDITTYFYFSGAATTETDYIIAGLGAANELTFAPNDPPQVFTITAVDDAISEGAETVVITMRFTGRADEAGTNPQTVRIQEVSQPSTSDDDDDSDQPAPAIAVFDPTLSKLGFIKPGQVGLLGEQIEWQVTVTNTGGVTGTNIIITDTLPDGLRIDRVSSNVSSSISGQTVTVTIPTLNVGQSITFSILTTVIDSDLTVVNIACLTADNNSQDICATGMVVRELPSTGETPWWAAWLKQK